MILMIQKIADTEIIYRDHHCNASKKRKFKYSPSLVYSIIRNPDAELCLKLKACYRKYIESSLETSEIHFH